MAEEKKETKKGNKVLVVFFILFLILSIGMGTFIFINKDKLFSKNTTSVEKNETKDSTKKDTNKETSTTSDECDKVSYDLNTNEYGLSVTNAGLSVNINPSRKSADISFNGATLSKTFSLGWVTAADTVAYEKIDTKTFDKKITQVLIDGCGQDASGMSIIYLLEDGTIEYVPILKDINANWGQTDNTKKFNSVKLDGVSNIISLISAEANGYHTVLARKADGTVINLSGKLQ